MVLQYKELDYLISFWQKLSRLFFKCILCTIMHILPSRQGYLPRKIRLTGMHHFDKSMDVERNIKVFGERIHVLTGKQP